MEGIVIVRQYKTNEGVGCVLLDRTPEEWLRFRYKDDVGTLRWEVKYYSLPPVINDELEKYDYVSAFKKSIYYFN